MKLIANKRRLLEIMLMLIICEIVNKRYSFSVVAQNNENRRVKPSSAELKLMRLIQANPALSKQLME